MSAEVRVDVLGLLSLRRQLQVLQLAPQRRQRLMARVAKAVIRDSKKRTRDQHDLDGNTYPERRRKRTHDRRKMLSRLVKALRVTQADSNSATSGFYKPSSGRLAADQQYGKTTRINSSSFGGRSQESYDLPATRRQARGLIDLGFKIAGRNGGARRSPTMKYITEHYTQGQAGRTLKRLRIWAGEQVKTSWTTRLPARSFLGATAAEVRTHIETIYDDLHQEMMRHGTR